MSSLIELKALIEREYVLSLMKDIDEMDLSKEEKDNLLHNRLEKDGIDLRRVVLGR